MCVCGRVWVVIYGIVDVISDLVIEIGKLGVQVNR